MSLLLQLELSDADLAKIAAMVAIKMRLGMNSHYTISEAAHILRVSVKTVRRRIKAGLIPTVQGILPPRIPAAWLDRQADPQPD